MRMYLFVDPTCNRCQNYLKMKEEKGEKGKDFVIVEMANKKYKAKIVQIGSKEFLENDYVFKMFETIAMNEDKILLPMLVIEQNSDLIYYFYNEKENVFEIKNKIKRV